MLGDGAGGFPTIQTFAANTDPANLVIGDFNSDSKQDVAVANVGPRTVSLLSGMGPEGYPLPLRLARRLHELKRG